MSGVCDLRQVGEGDRKREESTIGHNSVGNQKRCHGHGNKKQEGHVNTSSFTIEWTAQLTVGVCEGSGWSLEISSQGRLGALYSSLVALTAPFSSPEEVAFGFTIFLRSLSS